MKNLDRMIVPGCEEAVEKRNAASTCRERDPRCDDPAFAAQNPSICGVDPRCSNPDFAEAHPEICGPTTSRLILKPGNVLLCEGKTVQFRTFIQSGTVETEITTGLTYQSSNQNIALIGAVGGNATGIAQGIADISVQWMGKSAYAKVQVMPGADCCEDISNRLIILADNSQSMSVEFGGLYANKLSFLKAAAVKFLNGVDFDKDEVALMSFNDAPQLVQDFGASASDVTNSINALTIGGALTNVQAALSAAISAVNASAESNSRRVIVILSDFENKVGDDPAPEVSAFFESGGVVIVVAIRANGAGYTLGNRLASGGFFLNGFSTTAADVLASLDGLRSYFCSGTCIPNGDVYASRPALNYANLTNWNILNGEVDLIGQGSDGARAYDLAPGNGLYLDGAGSGPVFAATIETKQTFVFEPGFVYRVTARIAGNQRSESATGKTVVSVGTIFSEEVLREWSDPFSDEEFDFTVAAENSGAIRLQYVRSGGTNAYGHLWDLIQIENLTTGEVMFVETWDTENTVYIPPACGTSMQPAVGGGFDYFYGYDCDYTDCLHIPPDTQGPDPIIAPDVEVENPPTIYTSTKTVTVSCPDGQTGDDVTKTATATSIVSQADADTKATALATQQATDALVCSCDIAVNNILNFNVKYEPGDPVKTGLAATGNTSDDEWVEITAGNSIGVQARTTAGCLVGVYASVISSFIERANLTHPDAMMQSGIGAFDAGSGPSTPTTTRIGIEGLPVGEYEFYLYGHSENDDGNSEFTLQVGTFTSQSVPISITTYGPSSTANGYGAQSSTWVEGNQYVRIRCVITDASHSVVINAGIGADGLSRINGFQIKRLSGAPDGGSIVINPSGPATPYPSNKFFGGYTGIITSVKLEIFGFQHAFPDDVDIILAGPDGTHVLVMSDAGGGFALVAPGIDFSIKDGVGNPSIPDNTLIIAGTEYASSNYLTANDTFAPGGPPAPHQLSLTAFNGKDPNGAWKLWVIDDSALSSGAIQDWNLVITTAGGTPATNSDIEVNVTAISTITPSVGGLSVMSVIITNLGPDDATGLRFIGLIPGGSVAFPACGKFHAYSGPGAFTPGDYQFSSLIGNLAAGDSINVTVTLRGTIAGTFTVELSTTTTSPDLDDSNNQYASGAFTVT